MDNTKQTNRETKIESAPITENKREKIKCETRENGKKREKNNMSDRVTSLTILFFSFHFFKEETDVIKAPVRRADSSMRWMTGRVRVFNWIIDE
jgi:hypothetical protein